MFISSDFLGIQYGVNDKIARFFADREPPAGNLYWKDKLLYLRPEVGYLFIPLIADLLYKSGLSRDEILHEDFVSLMEKTGHIAALEEAKKIDHAEAIKLCIAESEKAKNRKWHENVSAFFTGTEHSMHKLRTPFAALHRGDYFLFSLSALSFDETSHEQIVSIWFALITTLLLLDDAEDVEVDKAAGEENAFLQSGMTTEGLAKIKQLVKASLQKIASINRVMANKIDSTYINVVAQPHISKMINI
jgi:hypothetical protein